VRRNNNLARSLYQTQNKPKALTRDLKLILKLKHPPSQYRDNMTAGLSISGETEAAAIRIHNTPSPPPRTGSTTHETPRAVHHIQDPAEMAVRRSELSPWQSRDHPLGEEHLSASMALRPVHGRKHGTQTLPPPQGQLQKPAPHMLRESDKRLHHARTQQASNNDTKSRPMRTADLAPQYHSWGASHAKGVPTL